MLRALLVLATLILSPPDQQEVLDLDDLQGVWRMKTSKGYLFEAWNPPHRAVMEGKSYMLSGTDSVILERTQIEERQDGTYYKAWAAGQNNGQAVAFRLVSSGQGLFVFENKQHDFPQRILYRFVRADSVVARIEGEEEGRSRGSDFYYKRVQ